MVRIFIKGLSTGFLLQIAIGPVFFFILNLSLQRTVNDGLLAVLAVTLVDYLYIALAILGVGKLLEDGKRKKHLAIVSSLVLVLFGILMLHSGGGAVSGAGAIVQEQSDYTESFLAAFFLTISSPLTIVFWTSLFAAKAIENSYTKGQLIVFGLAAGLATVLFLGSAVVGLSWFRASIPLGLIRGLNILVGLLLIAYGAVRLRKEIHM